MTRTSADPEARAWCDPGEAFSSSFRHASLADIIRLTLALPSSSAKTRRIAAPTYGQSALINSNPPVKDRSYNRSAPTIAPLIYLESNPSIMGHCEPAW